MIKILQSDQTEKAIIIVDKEYRIISFLGSISDYLI